MTHVNSNKNQTIFIFHSPIKTKTFLCNWNSSVIFLWKKYWCSICLELKCVNQRKLFIFFNRTREKKTGWKFFWNIFDIYHRLIFLKFNWTLALGGRENWLVQKKYILEKEIFCFIRRIEAKHDVTLKKYHGTVLLLPPPSSSSFRSFRSLCIVEIFIFVIYFLSFLLPFVLVS